jgi:drug/metabolite transporter (DMT)-like permease
LVALIWGVNLAVMKIGLEAVDLFVFNAFRLTLSALVLGICTSLENRAQTPATAGTQKIKTNHPRPFRMWTTIILFSIFSGGLYQILFAVGIDHTTAGNTALIISSMPMWIAVLSFFLLHEKLGWAWIGLIVAFLGTALVAMQKGSLSFDSENQFGNLMVLTAALAWALAAVISRPMLKFISPIRLAFYATVGTLPIHYAMPWIMDSPNIADVWQPGVLACIVYSGVFSTGLAYAMWNYGVQQLGASHAAVFQNLVPLVALIAAYVSPLHEMVTPMQIIGGSLILSGLFVTRRLRPS